MQNRDAGDHEIEPGVWQVIMGKLAPFFDDAEIPCPYGLPCTAVYHQALFGRLPDDVVGCFFSKGFRRNGNCLYSMACTGCRSCLPIRLRPVDFRPNRNQRRVWKKNADVEIEIGSVDFSDEKIALCNDFLDARFPGKGDRAREYYGSFFSNSLCTTVEVRYRAAGKLIGVAIVDISDQWLNGVYYYFDPKEASRSPGTFNVLAIIDFCKRENIPLCYLGYWIEGVPAMDYKVNFRPHWFLREGIWVEEPI